MCNLVHCVAYTSTCTSYKDSISNPIVKLLACNGFLLPYATVYVCDLTSVKVQDYVRGFHAVVSIVNTLYQHTIHCHA